ncbi:MAG: Dabb family protein [Acidimicrobiia bacterium]|nr:Dabb family protein [Acidimicrobiia bacterium]
MLRHVVLYRWKPETDPERIREIEDAFRALPGKIPQIAGFEWGRDVSVQGLNQGITHCFVVTFASEADRDVYATHPDHLAYIAFSRPHVDTILVLDYFADA